MSSFSAVNTLPASAENQIIVYAQLVIGPPGTGKSTYCFKMGNYLKAKFGVGNVKILNLDPGNDMLPYSCDLDVCNLITVEDVMDRMKLGPNGSLLYAMQFIDDNFVDEIQAKIPALFENADKGQPCWVLIDMPGQVLPNANIDYFCKLHSNTVLD